MLAATNFDYDNVLVAIIGFAGVMLTAWGAAHRVGKRVTEVHDEVKTNHGKRLGQYMEEVNDALVLHAERVERIEHNVGRMASEMGLMRGFAEGLSARHQKHVNEDQVAFEEIRGLLGTVIGNQDEIKRRGEEMTLHVADELGRIKSE